MNKPKECRDCKAEGRTGPRLNLHHINGVPVPGPRCYRHHLKRRRQVAEARAAKRRTRVYGLPPKVYEALLQLQGGVCYICLRPPKSKPLQPDHDHTCCKGDTSCGKCVRGLICGKDNRWLAWIGDDAALAFRAYEYLINPPAQRIAQAHPTNVG